MKRLKIILQSNLFYIVLFFIVFVFVVVSTKFIKYNSKIPDDISLITAKVLSFKVDGNKLSLNLKEREEFVATYYITSETEKKYLEDNLKIGVTIEVEGEKQEVLENTIPNTFNYKKYLYSKRIYFSFLIKKITLLDKKISMYDEMKNKINDRIKLLNNNAYLKAFILGDKSLMLNEVSSMIQDNGVSHLFALSGMHLSFVYSFLDKILKKFKFRKIPIYLFLLFYLIITSFPVSFIRAILFTLFLDINKILSLGVSKIKILFLVAVILLFIDPFYIYDIGFIYTFVVTFSLLFSNNILNTKNKFKSLFLVSLITFLFSAPITIYMNYEINIISVFNNIIMVPFVSFIVFPLSIFTFFFPFLLSLFTYLTNVLECLNTIMNMFSIFLVFGKINLFDVLLYYSLLMLFIKTKKRILMLCIFIQLIYVYNKDVFNNYTSVYFMDVGQGDSTLLVSPQNKEVILIDTGGKIEYKKEEWEERDKKYNLADTMLIFLKSMRIRKIDSLILTHGDYDHMGEAINLVNNFKVENVIFNNDEYNNLELEFIKVLEDKDIKYYQNIKELNMDNNKLYFLNNGIYDNENDNSNVIYTELNNYKFLFMGDAGIEVEEDILEKYNLSDIDILKVGHHGSKTSSSVEFIDNINPRYSIISVGKNNRYGHPNSNVLKNLENSIIYRTDLDGSIMFKINKDKIRIETHAP